MWSVGGAEKHGVGKEIRTFPLLSAVAGNTQASKTGKIRYLWMHEDSTAQTNASAMSVWTKRKVILKG